MDTSLYDEFGNYVGPELSESESESESKSKSGHGHEPVDNDWADEEGPSFSQAPNQPTTSSEIVPLHQSAQRVVLHEDKQYYAGAAVVYPGAEVLVEEEDTQPLETPLVRPIKHVLFEDVENRMPETSFSFEYLAGLMDHPGLVRHVAIAGHLHHGKTGLVDMMVQETHGKEWNPDTEYRYTDTRKDEQERGLSIKAVPMALVMPTIAGKSYLINAIDTPGHANFVDEQVAAIRLADGAVIVIDAAEGVMIQTEKAIENSLLAGLSIVVVVNKIDRLFLELKLPADDAYHKLCQTLEDVNAAAQKVVPHSTRIDPAAGNVVFASSKYGFCFSLQSFAFRYAKLYEGRMNYKDFAKRLWGNMYFNEETRKFGVNPVGNFSKRSFVQFILEPIYKIFSHVLSCDAPDLIPILQEINVQLKPSEFYLDAMPLLKIVLARYFENCSALVQAIVDHIPSPDIAAKTKIPLIYSGDETSELAVVMKNCDSSSHAPFMLHIAKLIPRADASEFDSFGRVFSGTVKLGDMVRVLGEGFSVDDEEDMSIKQITKIWIYEARYRIEVNQVKAGNLALFEGIDATINKTATVTSASNQSEVHIFRPLQFRTKSLVKIAIEPINPADLPKILDGLRKLNKSYPLLTTKVEESGEHIVFCNGELYGDCVLHDLRKMYSQESEIKVADPVVAFSETVSETSSIWCFAQTPNKKNKLTMLAEPLQPGLAFDIEMEKIRLLQPKTVSDFFVNKYGWDLLSSRSVWSFGPDSQGPNIIVDDTLPALTNKKLIYSVKDSIIQGFQWAAREGPLCDEPIRNVKFRLTNAIIADSPLMRSGGQIIPTSRRVAYSAFLLAVPRLMEPVYYAEIIAPADAVKAVFNVLSRRRGHVVAELPKPGTPLYIVQAYLPIIDSFGFETDLRTHTMGQAFCSCVFDHWEIVPGDPLDKRIPVRPLEPASAQGLARDFMVKTRRRKGLAEDVSINKFFDDEMFIELAKHEESMSSSNE